MDALEDLLTEYEGQLLGYPASLPRDFRSALVEVGQILPPDQLARWAQGGVELARQSLRSWEAAHEYFRVSPSTLRLVDFEAFLAWFEYGRELTAESSTLGATYFRLGPAVLGRSSVEEIRAWVELGRGVYRGTWKSGALATQLVEVSAALMRVLTLAEARALAAFVDAMAVHSYELATACLTAAPRVLASLDRADRMPFLRFAQTIAETCWADARAYFERGPALLAQVSSEERERFITLATGVSRSAGRQTFTYFAEAAEALGSLGRESHGYLLGLSESLVAYSGGTAMEFLKSVPQVLERLRLEDVERWHAEGRRILAASEEGGAAYFRLESGKGEEVLESLSSRVELSRVGEVLRMYCKALTGTDVSIQASSNLAEKGVGWVSEDRPTTEGTTVYLPPVIEEAPDKRENFAIYKVYATHQAAHLEFGSFLFHFERDGNVFGNSRRELAGRAGGGSAITQMERFFDLFPDRQLALDLFTIAEDARIDYLVKREYGGIRGAVNRVQARELDRRPAVERMALRQAFVENLVRASLDGADRIRWPRALTETMRSAVAVLRALQRPDALVEDAAEAALRLYRLAEGIPNLLPEDLEAELGDWSQVDLEAGMPDAASLKFDGSGGGEAGEGMQMADVPEDAQELAYQSPQEVGFRGDFKPELVQLLMKLRQEGKQGTAQGDMGQLTPEQLKELLEKSVEIDVAMEGDLASTTGLFLENLMKEAGSQQQQPPPVQPRDGQPVSDLSTPEEGGELQREARYFYYDEWDFRANDYKPRWCRVVEAPLEEGTEEFFERTLVEHAGLVAQTRKQFELMRPELFRKIKRLHDGEDFDLDALIDFVAERRSGRSPNEKIYWRRNKVERDVAVAFLLDMSASTDEEINRRERVHDDDFDDDPRRYLAWWAERRARELANPVKRIIDVEKESTVLLIKALETIGDTYGIYGFSGYGRDNVEFYVIKDLDEQFGERVKRRIDKIVPIRSTRMGPAIRHATAKLEQHDAKVKILMLVSDGRPQDHGYGRDRTEKEYAIHDTKMALNEAKRKGITPFALTVDRAGHDYLKTMCEDMGYEVLSDIAMLPSRLPTLYRLLTE